MPDPRYCAECATSLVQPADPALHPACPACGWFRATNALPVALVLAHTATGKILYTRQAGWPAGAWGLVAGFIESGETAEAAALREVREESGLLAREPRIVRTIAAGELLLVCITVDIDEQEPRAASDVEAAMLVAPDLALTPTGWPARNLIEAYIAGRDS